jgi:hypothetical protein
VSDGIAPRILDGGEWSASRPGRCNSKDKITGMHLSHAKVAMQTVRGTPVHANREL